MNGFWPGLTGRLAEKWLTLLILPGALYLATATTAHALGWRHALDLHRLTTLITSWVKSPIATTTGGQIVLLAAVLTAAAAAGLAAQALDAPAEHLALAAGWRTWRRPLRGLAEWRTNARRTAWTKAHKAYYLYDAHIEAT